MKVLVACECSNTVRDAFLRLGHDAYSCDLQRADHPNKNWRRHIRGDVRPLLREKWDLVIAHPPCTYLCNSGVRWMKENDDRYRMMLEGARFFIDCLLANAPMVAVENPIHHKYARELIPPYDQIIHPWQYGHREQKQTCLWLRGLPCLQGTNDVSEEMSIMPANMRCRIHYLSGKNRAKQRSKTFFGIARAMAEQWGCLK